jgi:hypothetical protein
MSIISTFVDSVLLRVIFVGNLIIRHQSYDRKTTRRKILFNAFRYYSTLARKHDENKHNMYYVQVD